MEELYRFPNIVNTLQVIGCHFGLKPSGWHYPRHHHHLFELVYCSQGEVVQEMHRDAVTMKAGDWLLIKSGVRHQSTNLAASDYGFFNVHFDLDDPEIRSLLAATPYRLIRSEAAGHSKLRFYVDELEAVMRRNRGELGEEAMPEPSLLRFEDKLLVQSYTLLIIHDVLRLLREHGSTSVNRPAPDKDPSLFAADVAHMIEEKLSLGLCEEATVAGVAKEMNLSRSWCSKLFAKVYGLSPRQYVSQQKLKLAKELLVTTHLPMTEIAEKLGFHSASHFSRQFRRWTGQSPSEFKPRHHTTQ
ncbi:helix-turn-helix domain-containing protein [Paenibacillus sp. GCM10023248]|uniref:AraC family transcriptional regulator n=1 Tax=Bacillales TaxID=1385 RepID=UPI00237887E6|nr:MULTISPECIES: AraC family transcriptional regulator [Bacillales]MDD9266868.1 helix-turn-helix domain-containing protein [Paenibacillus sp. MAHUQ-63]MDR6881068.1 AraC-like DNA-binding protein [Bacillus sp. 3255]